MLCGVQAREGLREADVEAVLKTVPVKLGAGRKQVGAVCICVSRSCPNALHPWVAVWRWRGWVDVKG